MQKDVVGEHGQGYLGWCDRRWPSLDGVRMEYKLCVMRGAPSLISSQSMAWVLEACTLNQQHTYLSYSMGSWMTLLVAGNEVIAGNWGEIILSCPQLICDKIVVIARPSALQGGTRTFVDMPCSGFQTCAAYPLEQD
jgi:hypothetical protein